MNPTNKYGNNTSGTAPMLNLRPWMAILWIGIGLSAGCDGSSSSGARPQASTDSAAGTMLAPTVPDRTPIDTWGVHSSNIYESICAIGNPFMVGGWELDADTRFLYFVGPFSDSTGSAESKTYPYLYKSIGSPERESVNTTLFLESLDSQERDRKPEELQHFLLPRLVAVDSNPQKIEQQLGKPDVVRELKKIGRTRLVYTRRVCFDDKLLAGMYFDIADGTVVRAKGVEHPEKLKWIASGNRPPAPDSKATYYQDQEPLTDSPQDIAIGFVVRRSNGDLTAARQLISNTEVTEWQLGKIIQASSMENAIDYGTLTYQTTRYALDSVEIVVTYEIAENATQVEEHYQLRKEGDSWRIAAWEKK